MADLRISEFSLASSLANADFGPFVQDTGGGVLATRRATMTTLKTYLSSSVSWLATGTASNTTYLRGDGTWAVPPGGGGGSGTVSSVAVSGGATGLTTSGGPVTGSGTITLAGTLAVANGGTGATTGPGALAALGAAASGAIGSSGLTQATGVLLGRYSAGTGAVQPIVVSTGLSLDGSGNLTATGSGSGTVTSVAVSGGTTGLSTSGGPITGTGTITLSGTLIPANGGTGLTSYAIGDLLYASGTTTVAKLADIATGNVLISGGVGAAPSYGKVGLTTHVTGILPVANLGTGTANTSTFLRGDGSWASPAVAETNTWALPTAANNPSSPYTVTGLTGSTTQRITGLGGDLVLNKPTGTFPAGRNWVAFQIAATGGPRAITFGTGITHSGIGVAPTFSVPSGGIIEIYLYTDDSGTTFQYGGDYDYATNKTAILTAWEMNSRNVGFSITNPANGTVILYPENLNFATITRVLCKTDTGTATANLQIADKTGTTNWTATGAASITGLSAISVTSTLAATTATAANTMLKTGLLDRMLQVVLTSVSGSPTSLDIWVEYTP